MNFDDFVKGGKVRVADKNESLVKSLVKTADEDFKFFDKMKIDDSSSRKLVSNFYDILRALLEALAISKGYKIYSHEAFTFFLNEIGEESLSEKFEVYRKIRNKINYYGKDVSVDEAEEYVNDIKELIKLLRRKF